jgi:hypothetical protein
MNFTRPKCALALVLGLLLALSASAAAPVTLTLAGPLTNTTQIVTAPGRFELTLDGDTVGGFLNVEAPLPAGRWPVEGMRRGAWFELVCRTTKTTRLVFRGVLSPTELRGNFISDGGEVVEYGRFRAAVVPSSAPSKL